MGLDFEDRLEGNFQAARRAAGMPAMQVFHIARGHPNEYHLVTVVPSLAAANGAGQPMPPAVYATWFGICDGGFRWFLSQSAIHSTVSKQRGRRAAGAPIAADDVRDLGKEAEYENWIANQFMPAFRQTNPLGHTMSRGVFGDNVSNFYHAEPIANWAAFDAGDPLVQVLGERRMEQMLANGLDGVVESSELVVSSDSLRPDGPELTRCCNASGRLGRRPLAWLWRPEIQVQRYACEEVERID